MNNYEKEVEYLSKTFASSFSKVKSDIDSGKSLEIEIVKRDKKYTELLLNYVTITERRSENKERHKWIFSGWLLLLVQLFCIWYTKQ